MSLLNKATFRKISAILLILASMLTLTACGSASRNPAIVTINGKKFDFSPDLPDTVYNLSKNDYVIMNELLHKIYNPDDEEFSGTYKPGDKVDIWVSPGFSSAGIGDGFLASCNYCFPKDLLEDTVFFRKITADSDPDDFLEAGFISTGSHYVCLYADGKVVDTDTYYDLGYDYASQYGTRPLRRFLIEKNLVEDDDETLRRYVSGSAPVNLSLNMLSSASTLSAILQSEGSDSISNSSYSSNEAFVNSCILYLAAMDLGQKFDNHDIESYGAIMIDNPENSVVSNTFISTAASYEKVKRWLRK